MAHNDEGRVLEGLAFTEENIERLVTMALPAGDTIGRLVEAAQSLKDDAN